MNLIGDAFKGIKQENVNVSNLEAEKANTENEINEKESIFEETKTEDSTESSATGNTESSEESNDTSEE